VEHAQKVRESKKAAKEALVIEEREKAIKQDQLQLGLEEIYSLIGYSEWHLLTSLAIFDF
jgi:hypothetical protein